ncbi:MAG: Cys-tRNA(Pro) deacylase [Lentisphaeria bacterium]|nr:Cys-tRNA(Pro) deacylase [Lentisphaeria bacterium]
MNRTSSAKTNAIRLLESAGIIFAAHEYPVDDGLIDARSIARKLGRTPDEVFKTLVAESPAHEHYVFVIPAAGELDLKKAALAADRKSIEMIPQKQLFPLTGYVHGGCSPIGMKKLFPTFIDETAQLFEYIFVSGGKIGVNLEIAPDLLSSFIQAQYADLTKN